MISKRVTIKDIAEKLDLSHSTVSLALREDPRIPKTTRDRIRRKASELGYVPDPVLSEAMGYLRTQKPASRYGTIAWINHRNEEDFWRKHAWSRIFMEGARKRAQELGYRLEEFWLGPYAERRSGEQIDAILKARGIRAVLIAPLVEQEHPWQLNWSVFSTVSITPFTFEPSINYVDSDDYYNMDLAIQKLRAAGCQRIGLIKHRRAHTLGYDLGVAAYLHYQDTLPPKLRMPFLLFEPLPPGAWGAFDKWRAHYKPDAIISCEMPLLSHLEEKGVAGAKNLSLVNIGVYSSGAPRGNSIDQQIAAISAAAINQLALQLQHHQYGISTAPTATLIKGRWRSGAD